MEDWVKIWDDLDHRLSVIKRWGTAPKVHEQSDAEHIFNVERMAVRIAVYWFGKTTPEELFPIMLYAHHHEDSEALSGDLPTMIKPYFDTKGFEEDHKSLLPSVICPSDETRAIVKLADMLDAFWFLVVEHKLGNNYLNSHFDKEPSRIIQFTESTWPNNVRLLKQVNLAINDFLGENSMRHSKRGN